MALAETPRPEITNTSFLSEGAKILQTSTDTDGSILTSMAVPRLRDLIVETYRLDPKKVEPALLKELMHYSDVPVGEPEKSRILSKIFNEVIPAEKRAISKEVSAEEVPTDSIAAQVKSTLG